MSIELILTTLKDESDKGQNSAKLERLAEALRRRVRKSGRTEEDVEASAEEVLVDLPGGTGRIHSDHAIFPIEVLDPLTLGVIFDVAKTGDMVVLTEGVSTPSFKTMISGFLLASAKSPRWSPSVLYWSSGP